VTASRVFSLSIMVPFSIFTSSSLKSTGDHTISINRIYETAEYITYKGCPYKIHRQSDLDMPGLQVSLEIPKVVNEYVNFVLKGTIILEVGNAHTSFQALYCDCGVSYVFFRCWNNCHIRCWRLLSVSDNHFTILISALHIV
jgi:hypothetical protein